MTPWSPSILIQVDLGSLIRLPQLQLVKGMKLFVGEELSPVQRASRKIGRASRLIIDAGPKGRDNGEVGHACTGTAFVNK